MVIRLEQASDIQYIEKIIYDAFLGHPHHAPGAKPTEHLIVNNLRDNGSLSLSLVYVDGDNIIGHIAVSPIKIDGKDSNWYGIAPVSVVKDKQGMGIGSKLMKQAMDVMREKGIDGFVLLGDPEYYGRFGFIADSRLVFEGVPAEYFLCHSFIGDDIPTGVVSYDSAFS